MKRTIRVFTEGEKTEPQYLTAWHRENRGYVTVDIRPEHGRDPMTLVELAVADKAYEEREQRKARGTAPDEYWCVFDVDEHPRLEEAMALAASHGIYVALSNPCIEIWLLWHYRDHQRHEHRRDLQRTLKAESGIDKTLSPAHQTTLKTKYDDARSRAQKLAKKHEDDGSPEHCNPSSNVWAIVESIRRQPAKNVAG